MQLLRLAEVPVSDADIVFAYSRTRAVFIVAILLLAASGLVVMSARTQAWLGYYVAGLIIVGLLIYWRMISARFRPSNWLVRMTDGGLFIQVRSYLNCHFPAEDQTVVFIPYAEISSARRVDETQLVPDRDEHNPPAMTARRVRWLEIELACDTRHLASALAGERDMVLGTARAGRKRPSTRYRHFPVLLSSPRLLRIEWNVAPAIESILDGLTRHTSVRPDERSISDLVNLDGLAREDQEARLLELTETGDTFAAISLARRLYGYDLGQAKDFVEGLARSPRARRRL